MQEMQETWVWTLGQEDPLEDAWQSTPVFLPGESHGQRSLEGYIVHRVSKSQTRLKRLTTHSLLYQTVVSSSLLPLKKSSAPLYGYNTSLYFPDSLSLSCPSWSSPPHSFGSSISRSKKIASQFLKEGRFFSHFSSSSPANSTFSPDITHTLSIPHSPCLPQDLFPLKMLWA